MERNLTVMNKLGLHARPAAEFVKAARSFKSRVVIRRGEEIFSAGSILDLLSACLDQGCDFVLVADGPDAEEALDRLASLLYEFKLREEP
jgi:phosphotransferase system HPr (HPr) family protein